MFFNHNHEVRFNHSGILYLLKKLLFYKLDKDSIPSRNICKGTNINFILCKKMSFNTNFSMVPYPDDFHQQKDVSSQQTKSSYFLLTKH